MFKYYLLRALIAITLTAIMVASGLVWWVAVLIGLLVFATFVLLARSGRYVAQSGGGFTPMRRDEMGQEINRRAGLYGYATLVISLGGLIFYYGVIAESSVPVFLLGVVLVLGVVVYMVTDYSLRRL